MPEVNELTTKYHPLRENIYAVDHVAEGREGKSLGIAGESGLWQVDAGAQSDGLLFPAALLPAARSSLMVRTFPGWIRTNCAKRSWAVRSPTFPRSAMNALNPTQPDHQLHRRCDRSAQALRGPRKRFTTRPKASSTVLGLPAGGAEQIPRGAVGGMKQRTVIAISVILSPRFSSPMNPRRRST